MTLITEQIIKGLREVVDSPGEFVPLHVPSFEGSEWSYVKECLDTGWVSSAGKFVDQFEEVLASFCGVNRAVAVSNGTAALHIGMVVSGVVAGDEVIMPTLTFVATANAVSYIGAVPHFADIETETFGVDACKLEEHLNEIGEMRDGHCYNKQTGRRISALVPMHTFGHPSDLDELLRVSKLFGLVMVEDAAESLGSYYKGKHTGGIGKVGAVSFNGNKIITTGGGGAILTNDEALADRAKHLTTTAKLNHPWKYEHDCVGYNYRMPNINAALGVAQLEKLPEFLERKRSLAAHYENVFSSIEGVTFVSEPAGSRSNYWLCALLLDEENEGELDTVLKETNASGIMTRPVWTPMHELSMYADCPRMDLSTSESVSRRLFNIPSSSSI